VQQTVTEVVTAYDQHGTFRPTSADIDS